MQTIRKPSVLRRLTRRLGIEPGIIATDMLLSNVVALGTDLGELLGEPEVEFHTGNLQTGNIDATVPKGKRWHLLGLMKGSTTGASTLRLVAPSGDTFDLLATSTSSWNQLYGRGYIDERWIIRMLQTSNAGDASGKGFSRWVIVEDSF